MGFSTIIALETTHAATVRSEYNANIVSTTQEEAADKLRVGDRLYSSIPSDFIDAGFKPVKYKNAEDVLAFHMPPYTSTITSKPGTSAIRGGKKDMYYDEAAFIKEFPRLYQAGLPAITRGMGRMTVISTPFGETGLYHELWNDKSWSHHEVPWWESRFMVDGENYEVVAEAMEKAPSMSTLERVDAFGSDKIKDILHKGLRDDLIAFQTEYECMFVDEAESYYTLDLIRGCVDEALPLWKEWRYGYQPEWKVSIGVDLAKQRDSSVFTVIEHRVDEEGIETAVVRYIYVTQADYTEQFEVLRKLAITTGAQRVSIDATGPGAMFYERARNEGLGGAHVEGIVFTNKKKEEWATQFKGDLQQEKVKLLNNAELIHQIHGIKRQKTVSANFRFSGDKDDYFWSLMLGLYGEGTRPVRFYKLGW